MTILNNCMQSQGMKRKAGIFVGFALAASLFAGAAYSQTPSPEYSALSIQRRESENFSSQNQPLYEELDQLQINQLQLWGFLAVTLSAGAFGGLIYHLINFKEIQEILREEAKRRGVKVSPLSRISSCASHIAIGAAVAPPAILILRPESAFALLAMSFIAGSVGSAVFRNVQEKLLANLAKVKAEHEAAMQQALLLNHEQSEVVQRLLLIADKHPSDLNDWREVGKIAEELKANCRMSRRTFESSQKDEMDSTQLHPDFDHLQDELTTLNSKESYV